MKRGRVTTKKKLQATNIFFRTALKRLVSKLVDPQGDYYFYVKEYLSKYVKILKETPYSFWLEIDCSIFTNLDQNLVISAHYIPPVSSKYYGQNTIENLRGDLLKFCDETTPVILIGDFF